MTNGVMNPADRAAIAVSIIPYNRDSYRARWLGYRSCGFTTREACKLTGVTQSAVSFWRKDPEFVALEERLPELRKTLGMEYAHLEFLRNYRMVLKKDYDVIVRSLTDVDELSAGDKQYLLKARSHYTPQQLEVITALASDGDGSDRKFNFTEFVLTLSRVQEKIELRGETK